MVGVLFCVVLPRPRLLLTFESLATKHSFVSFQTRRNFNRFEVIILKKWYQQIRYGEYKQKLRYDK